MKITVLLAAASIATVSASAQTKSEAPLPSTTEYFELAAEVQTCNGGEPAKVPELEALRSQTLDYYRTKLSRAGSDSDPVSASAVQALEANIVPAETLKRALSMKHIAANWAGWCRGVPSNIRYAQARHDLAMATIGWPGAVPLDQARKAVAEFEVHATRVMIMPPSPSPPPPPNAAPHLVSCPKPDYPPAAIRMMAEGTTAVSLDVDDSGRVVGGEIASSSGTTRAHQLLDATALGAMRACVFDASSNEALRHARLTYTWALNVEAGAPSAAAR